MRQIRGARLALVALVACGAVTLSMTGSFAGKPGGGSPPPPTGTIYCRDQASGTYPYQLLYSMDGSGGNRTLVMQTDGNNVRASRRLHGGKRWLLTLEDVPGEPGMLGGPRRDVFAVREDGALHVRLTAHPTREYWRLAWAPDENAGGATVSMFGREWTGTTASDTVVAGTLGLYTAHLTFDGNGDVVGLDTEPAFAISLGMVVQGGWPQPDAYCYSWSPDMTRLVTDNRGREQIRVVTVASGEVLALGTGNSPDWSPDGSRIAYTRFVPSSTNRTGAQDKWALQTVNPDGTGITTVTSVPDNIHGYFQNLSWPKWSPDGAYLAYARVSDSNYVYRVAVNGSGNTNLTPDATPGGLGFGFVLIDWR